MEKTNKQIKQNFIWLFFAAIGLGIILWKAKYGYGGDDESFYLTIPHRLLYGDIFIKDEWHLSQLSAFLNIPFVWIYHAVTGSMTGVVLAARYYYVIVHFLFSLVIYIRLKKFGTVSAAASVLFLVYVPFNISEYSYNSICVDLLAVLGVIMATNISKNRMLIYLSGIMFAAAVLCCPYMAVVYLLYFCVVIIQKTVLKDNKKILDSDLNEFVTFSLGVFTLAAAFFVFLISRGGFDNFFENIKMMLSDPEHMENGIIYKIKIYILDVLNWSKLNNTAVIFYAAFAAAVFFDKKRKNHRVVYLLLNWTSAAIFTVLYLVLSKSECYNVIMYPLAVSGFVSYCFLEHKPKNLFAWVYLMGIVYSVAVNFSSNVCFYVITMAMSVSDIASCIFMGMLLKEVGNQKEISKQLKSVLAVICFIVLSAQLAAESFSRIVYCFWDRPAYELSETISCGPSAGIKTTKKNKNNREMLYNDLKYYNSVEKDEILCLTQNTDLYLAADFPYGTFSAWTSGVEEDAQEKLKQFYGINAEKMPRYVYMPKGYYNTRYDICEEYDFKDFCNYLEASGYHLTEENEISYKYEK